MNTSAFVEERSRLLLSAIVDYVNIRTSLARELCLELNEGHFRIVRGVEAPLYLASPIVTRKYNSSDLSMQASVTMVARTAPEAMPALAFDAEVRGPACDAHTCVDQRPLCLSR